MDAYSRMVEQAREQKRLILSYPIHRVQGFTVHMVVVEIQLIYSINIKRLILHPPTSSQPFSHTFKWLLKLPLN